MACCKYKEGGTSDSLLDLEGFTEEVIFEQDKKRNFSVRN